ncbi:Uncharacterised protein [Klebsiella pneumoniae]|uniref:Uncharacterized protein n=1 Tax=Klebsiella pneumoniae TaxID=573 RepID=A0A377UVG0_KLEPN|nr:Uncharacterised protein [Klebsiella pneumoniae]
MAGAQRMHYQGMKAVDPQRMSRNAGDTGQGPALSQFLASVSRVTAQTNTAGPQ